MGVPGMGRGGRGDPGLMPLAGKHLSGPPHRAQEPKLASVCDVKCATPLRDMAASDKAGCVRDGEGSWHRHQGGSSEAPSSRDR